jgi:hypothetical protein
MLSQWERWTGWVVPGWKAKVAHAPGRLGAERRAAGALEAEILAGLRAADGPLTPARSASGSRPA